MLTIGIQPYFPNAELFRPSDIKNSNNDIRWKDFPNLNLSPIPEGAILFHWGESDGYLECQQIYSKGLIWIKTDVLRADNTKRETHIWRISSNLFRLLKYAKLYYKKAGYQGGLRGSVKVDGLTDVTIKRIMPSGYWGLDDDNEGVLSEYSWHIETDTNIISEEKALVHYFLEIIRDIYWGFGYESAGDDLIITSLKQDGLLSQDFTLVEPTKVNENEKLV